VLAIGLGYLAYRNRHDPIRIVWLAGLALALRCLTESVMVPYYAMPAIAIALVAATRFRPARVVATFLAGAGLLCLTYFKPGEWPYWLEMTGTVLVMYGATFPWLPSLARWRIWRIPENEEDEEKASAIEPAAVAHNLDDGVPLPVRHLRAATSGSPGAV